MSSPATIEHVLRSHDSGEYFARLANQPAPHAWRRTPELVYHARLNALEPRFTIVTPAFNHEAIIAAAIDAAAAAASLPFDCIIVDDGSTDNTAARARSVFESRRSPLIARATIIRNPVPIYETACDNLGFALAETEIIVEVQADIQIREPAFDALFLRALDTTPDAECAVGSMRTHVRVAPPPRRHSIALPPNAAPVGRAVRQDDRDAGDRQPDPRADLPL